MTSELSIFTEKVRDLPAAHVGRGRVVFILDATGSRDEMWKATSKLTHQAFEAVAGQNLDVKLICFRGGESRGGWADDGPRECRAYKWVSTAKELRAFMDGVKCTSGKTQMVRAISHVTKMADKPAAVVYLGDMCEEEPYDVVEAARATGVRFFVLQDNPPWLVDGETDDRIEKARGLFKAIADATGGAYSPLSRASDIGAMMAAVAKYASK